MGAFKLNEISFVEDKNVRDQYIGKTEVLNKVKLLTLLPDNKYVEARELANYFEVDIDTIRQIRNRHKDELDSDGVITLIGDNFKNYKQEIALHGVTLLAKSNITLYPRRSVLRIGMLLRDSEIAKQVRTYLLNIEESASKEQKLKSASKLGTWTSKEELILLDCYYTTVLNGGSLNEASKLASQKIDHTSGACMTRYATHLKEIITDDKFFQNVADNRRNGKKHLSVVDNVKNKEILENENMIEQESLNGLDVNALITQINNLSLYIDNVSEENIKLLHEKVNNLETENSSLKSRVKRLIKDKKETVEELESTRAVIATAIQINVNSDIKNAFKMDRNGNLERVQ